MTGQTTNTQTNEAEAAAAAAEQAAAEKAAAAEKKAAEKAAAKAAKDEAKAKAKAEKEAAAAQKKAEKEAAAEAKKADAEAKKAAAIKEREDKKAAAKAAKDANRMPEQNGVRRPKPATLCGQAWTIFDELSAKHGSPAPIGESLEIARAKGFNEGNVKAEYARWRKFHGITGRVVVAKPVAEPAAPTQQAE